MYAIGNRDRLKWMVLLCGCTRIECVSRCTYGAGATAETAFDYFVPSIYNAILFIIVLFCCCCGCIFSFCCTQLFYCILFCPYISILHKIIAIFCTTKWRQWTRELLLKASDWILFFFFSCTSQLRMRHWGSEKDLCSGMGHRSTDHNRMAVCRHEH